MVSPIERLIDASVVCVQCGTQGFGNCHCWERVPAVVAREKHQWRQAQGTRVARHVLQHIDAMYPQLWEGVTKNARRSLRGCIIREVMQLLQDCMRHEEGG